MLQFGLAERIEKIRLVFTRVISFAQTKIGRVRIYLSIVTSSNVLSTKSIGVVKELSKLYFSIAKNVRVGCASSSILLKKDLEDTFPVFV